jgi:hypothetical protein
MVWSVKGNSKNEYGTDRGLRVKATLSAAVVVGVGAAALAGSATAQAAEPAAAAPIPGSSSIWTVGDIARTNTSQRGDAFGSRRVRRFWVRLPGQVRPIRGEAAIVCCLR